MNTTTTFKEIASSFCEQIEKYILNMNLSYLNHKYFWNQSEMTKMYPVSRFHVCFLDIFSISLFLHVLLISLCYRLVI